MDWTAEENGCNALIDSFADEWDRRVALGEMVDGLDVLEALPEAKPFPSYEERLARPAAVVNLRCGVVAHGFGCCAPRRWHTNADHGATRPTLTQTLR